MELYILDSLYRRHYVVDVFESLIWSERWKEDGDFELVVNSTKENRSLFVNNTKLAMNNSQRVMVVEEVEDTISEDGELTLTVSGPSLESILRHRVAWYDLGSEDPWYITSSLIGLPRTLFAMLCLHDSTWGAPLLDSKDALPFVTQRFPSPEIPVNETVIDWVQDQPEILYDAIKKHCDSYDLGFRLLREDDSTNLYFEIYTGRDRTSRQTNNSPVIFSVDFDSVQDTTEFSSIKNYKNMIYVVSNGYGHATIRGSGVDPGISGFDRRVHLESVNVPQDYAGPHILLSRKGLEAAQQRRPVSIFEGEINQYTNYKYGVDYHLGDLVEMRNKDGVVSYKHVTEQIFVDDANGERAYPTLSVGRFEDPNTWSSWGIKDEEWADMGSEVWTDM